MTLLEYMLEHPASNRQWHPTRNTLNPALLTPGSKKRAWFQCEQGHEWEASIQSVITEGCGCPYCAGKRAISGINDLATVRPEILQEWDFEKNSEFDPETILPSSHRKVWWKCELGHSWEARIFSRTKENGSQCPYCTGKLVLAGFNDLATLKPKIAEEWYQPLNGELTAEAVTIQSNKKVWWQCAEGHVWQAAVYSRTRKKASGCPVCAGTVKGRRSSAVAIRQGQRKIQSRRSTEWADAIVNM